MAIFFYLVFTLLNPSEFRGLPVDAFVPGVAYSVTSRFGFPNIDNPSSFSLLTQSGLVLTFAYIPESISDILNYISHVKLRNLTAVGFYSKGAGFYYRLVNRREIKMPEKEMEYSIDKFSLVISEMLYYNLYGGLSLSYYYVRFGEASIVNGIPQVHLDTGNGFSIDIGMAYKSKWFSAGFSLLNLVSGIYYGKFNRDILNPSGSAGVNFEPVDNFSLSMDFFIEKKGKPYYSSALRLKPLRWVFIFGGVSFNDRGYGIGVDLNYKSNNFIISYRKRGIHLTWRYAFE